MEELLSLPGVAEGLVMIWGFIVIGDRVAYNKKFGREQLRLHNPAAV